MFSLAPAGFEPASRGPGPLMIGHYTRGLSKDKKKDHSCLHLSTVALILSKPIYLSKNFFLKRLQGLYGDTVFNSVRLLFRTAYRGLPENLLQSFILLSQFRGLIFSDRT